MARISAAFPVPQMQGPLQIIQFNGPPKPKQTSRRNPSKVPSSADGPRSNTEQGNKEDLVLTLDEVEVIDLTCLEKATAKSAVVELEKVTIVSLLRTNGKVQGQSKSSQCEPLEKIQEMRAQTSRLPEGSSQVNAVVIEDSQSDSDTDEGGSHEEDTGTRIRDQLAVSSILTPECRGTECPTDAEDAIDPEAVDGAGTQVSGPPRRKPASTLPTSASMMHAEQPAQVASGQRPIPEKAEREGKFPLLEITSSSSSSSDGSDDDDNNDNHTRRLTRKRKRSPPAKRHSRTSNTTSKQRPKRAAHSVRQRKPSSRGGPLSNHPSGPKPLSAAQYSGYDTKICYSDDSSKESSDRDRHFGSNKRPKSNPRPGRSRNRGSADEDDEYEVERILKARVNRGKLQYRAKWLEYEDDPVWYDASNFKNSPHRLRGFHTANPLCPGPPKRLGMWVQCWEGCEDVDDHFDDDKPERYTRL